jgi:hypothetical protein
VNKTMYQSTFGCYAVTVNASSEQEAINKIKDKISGYKDGSSKGDYIRAYIDKMPDIKPFKVVLKGGFYREA